jgi:hypothetical protein
MLMSARQSLLHYAANKLEQANDTAIRPDVNVKCGRVSSQAWHRAHVAHDWVDKTGAN